MTLAFITILFIVALYLCAAAIGSALHESSGAACVLLLLAMALVFWAGVIWAKA